MKRPSVTRAAAEHVVGALRAALARDRERDAPPTLIVALSGGLDSCVLLHALRFSIGSGTDRLSAAHFDHRMRPGSAADAAWIRGVCRAWGVPLTEGRIGDDTEPPTSEDAARTARYAFLRSTAADATREADGGGRALILTAHHADDQAETVLFRVLRGTGIDGLAGIPARRATADRGVVIVRPLLDVWREDLEAYAAHHGLAWRDDPTNEALGYARNVLRHEILPRAEESVAPGARRSLVRLAGIARDEGAAWEAAMAIVLDRVEARHEGGASPGCPNSASAARDALLALHPALAARVVRHLAGRVGLGLDADTTRRALDFVRDSQSGRRIELGAGVELHLEGARVRIEGNTP